LGLFTAEVFVTSYGALATGGIVCLVMGGLMLVDSLAGFTRVSLVVIAPVAAATAFITIFLVTSILRAHRNPVLTGTESLIDTNAVATDAFLHQQDQYTGTVRVHGEFWKAISETPIGSNQTVRIRSRDGLTLVVEPESAEHPASSESL
jgi:membrane-bound serine protease (ClpP class)